MITVFQFLILALASFRVTRLVVQDSILDRPRHWFHWHWPPTGSEWKTRPKHGKSAYVNASEPKFRVVKGTFLGNLTECFYCSGVWVSAGVLGLFLLSNPVVWWILVGAAVAGAQALIGNVDNSI